MLLPTDPPLPGSGSQEEPPVADTPPGAAALTAVYVVLCALVLGAVGVRW